MPEAQIAPENNKTMPKRDQDAWYTRRVTSTPSPSVFSHDGTMAQRTTTCAMLSLWTCLGHPQATARHSLKGWAIPMITMTEEMRDLIDNAIANGTPCILATATKTGVPHMSFRGSMMVLDDASLAYWDRVKRQSLQHITENPHVCPVPPSPQAHHLAVCGGGLDSLQRASAGPGDGADGATRARPRPGAPGSRRSNAGQHNTGRQWGRLPAARRGVAARSPAVPWATALVASS